jgi:hypothetical protein
MKILTHHTVQQFQQNRKKLDDGRIQPKHVVRRQETDDKLHWGQKYIV